MQRREAHVAREARRKEERLFELDYLLGVYDEHRLGGLRYRLEGGPFLDDDAKLASPPWTSLRELEQACLHFESAGSERGVQTWPSAPASSWPRQSVVGSTANTTRSSRDASTARAAVSAAFSRPR